jgi:hypothetical protein
MRCLACGKGELVDMMSGHEIKAGRTHVFAQSLRQVRGEEERGRREGTFGVPGKLGKFDSK